MSLMVRWSLFRPESDPIVRCPRCTTQLIDPLVVIRHEHARFAGHAPAWVECADHTFAATIATGDDCAELRP